MSTTSLKLTAALKRRIAAAAKRRGKTPHAFMVDAIERVAEADEARSRFIAEADAARKEALRTGKGFSAEDTHAYMRRRIAGKTARRPKPKVWRD